MQRDYFLPLKVIREHIDAMERGLEPPSVSDATPKPPRALESIDSINVSQHHSAIRLTSTELAAAVEVPVDFIAQLSEYGLVAPDSQGHFDGLALNITSVCKTLNSFGLEARHLKAVLQSASREVDLFSPIVKSASTGKNPASNVQAKELEMQLATSVVKLHELLVRSIITK
jgi:hypothetical protein